MKTFLLVSSFVLSTACFAGEASVLNHGAATPAPAAVEQTADDDCACKCRTRRERLYNVEEQCSEHCRHRLFGGTVVRKTARTVYKPVRR